jgi:hypothetical protein
MKTIEKIMVVCERVLWVVLVNLVVCNCASALTILDPTCSAETYVTYTDSVQGEARHMAFDNNGNLYITQQGEQSVWRVTPQKVASQFAAGISNAFSITWGGGTAYGSNLYVSGGAYIAKVTPAGVVSYFANMSISNGSVSSLAIDTTGNYGGYLYAGTGSVDYTYRVNTSGGVTLFSYFPGWRDGGFPCGIAFYNGNKYSKAMYMGAYYDSISNAAASGLFTLDTSGNATRFNNSLVQAFAINFAGNTYFDGQLMAIGRADYSSPVGIWSIDPSGTAREIALSPTLNVLGLTFGNDGAMYISEYSQNNGLITVSRVVPDPATLLLLGLGGLFLRKKY